MFFEFSKILDFVLSPFIWALLLFLLAFLMKRRPQRRWGLVIAGFSVLIFFSNSFITDEFVRISEAEMVSDSIEKPYDVCIVLGGGMVTEAGTEGRLIFQQNTDRMLQAVKLYKEGKVKKILVSSGSGSIVFKEILEAALVRKYLLSIGIPDSVILIDSVSRNTYENARFSAQILHDDVPNGHYLLLTSALHMNRARYCFLKQGVLVDTYPVGKMTGGRRWDIGHLLLPLPRNLQTWEKLLHEWVGWLVYRLKGYV